MSYDEPDEPDDEEQGATEPEPGSTPAGTFTATVSREEIAGLVAQRFLAQMNSAYNNEGIATEAKRALRQLVRKRAEGEIETITAEAIRVATADIIANGWSKTDGYGRTAGTVTVRDVVVGHLTTHDSYDRKTRSLVIAEELFREAVKKEIEPLLEQVKAHLRKLLDDGVGKAIRTALLQGAGLGRE